MFDRTFHPDEANQAFTTGRLLETGTYQYNPQDHHGPTLYYAAATIQKAAGHSSTATLDGTLLRCTPLVFAVLALVFGMLSVRKLTGHLWHGLLFALLLGTAPIFVFFATDFIQEMLLASFTMMMFWAGVGYRFSLPDAARQRPSKIKPGTWALMFGIAAGLALATKETAILTFAAAALAGIPFAWRNRKAIVHERRNAALAFAGFVLTSVLLYSSFCDNWHGVYNAFVAAPLSYFHRAAGSVASTGAAWHVHPWWKHLYWLFADDYDGVQLFFIVCGILFGLASSFAGLSIRPDARTAIRGTQLNAFRFTLSYALLLLAFYSLIPYKTPWCALQIIIGLLMAAMLGFCVERDIYVQTGMLAPLPGWSKMRKDSATWWRTHPRLLKMFGMMHLILAAAIMLFSNCFGLVHLLRDPDSTENRFNYAAASPQVKELSALILGKIARQTDTHAPKLPKTDGPFVAVALPPEDTWPLPFYLRTAGDKVGYWTQFAEIEALAGLGVKPAIVVVPAENGHLVQPLFPHLKNTKRFEMRPHVRVRAFW